jgi:hypothetical protein
VLKLLHCDALRVREQLCVMLVKCIRETDSAFSDTLLVLLAVLTSWKTG